MNDSFGAPARKRHERSMDHTYNIQKPVKWKIRLGATDEAPEPLRINVPESGR
jgi:hypothetical protein